MNLADYWDGLNRHDWYYMYSDNDSVYRKGSENEARLARISKESPEHAKLWEGFNKHHFSGLPWKTPKAPKPRRPAEPVPCPYPAAVEYTTVEGGRWWPMNTPDGHRELFAIKFADGWIWDRKVGWRREP